MILNDLDNDEVIVNLLKIDDKEFEIFKNCDLKIFKYKKYFNNYKRKSR